MSARPDPALPLIKPYSGASENFWQRRLTLIVSVIAAIACLPYGFYYALLTPWLLVPLLVPVVILAGVVIWALPNSRSVPDKTLERLFFIYFIALIAWPNYLAVDLPGLPWITLSRVIGTPMALLMLMSVSISPPFRKQMGEILSASPWVWRSLLLFVALQTVSLPFSPSPGDSIARYVVAQATQTAIFFVTCWVFRKPGPTSRWAGMLWALAIFVSGIALVENRLHHVPWAGHVPGFLQVQDEVVQRILTGSVRSTTGQYRTASVFTTPLGLSEFLALTMPFVLHFAASKSSRLMVRLAAAASVPLMLLVILYTDSRLGLVGFFLSVMLYALYWGLQQWRRNRGALLAPAIVLAYPAMFSIFVILSFTIGRVRAKVWGTGQYDASNQGRIDQLEMGLPKVFTHPLGHGAGMGAQVLNYFNPAGTRTIDSYWLAMALEYGALGLIAFLAMFGISSFTAARRAMSARARNTELEFLVPLSIAIVVFLVIKLIFAQDDNHPLMFIMMGMVAALAYRVRKEGDAPPAAPAPAKTLARRA